MTKSEKKYDTSLRILEILKVLLNENIKKIELIEKLKTNDKIETVYTQEAFIKYFNTLEVLGFELEKVKNRYILNNALQQVSISLKEKNVLKEAIEGYRNIGNKTIDKNLRSAFVKINKYLSIPFPYLEFEELFDKELKVNYNDVKEKLIYTINNMIADEQLVKIKYRRTKNQIEEMIVEAKDVVEKNQKFFMACYCPKLGRNKKIDLEKIVSVVQLPRKKSGQGCLSPVVFELYGRLARSYKFKPSEKAINFGPNHITVSNLEEDRDTLLRRLLKYGENCKIIKPKEMQIEFMKLTNEMLKNLEGFDG